jgi:hypothetical protein
MRAIMKAIIGLDQLSELTTGWGKTAIAWLGQNGHSGRFAPRLCSVLFSSLYCLMHLYLQWVIL